MIATRGFVEVSGGLFRRDSANARRRR